ncbi:MAG: 1-acyl-sn-glycerol-3-phosphate acyltransferase [Arenicella sp.]
MLQKICAFILYRLLGWRIEGEVPRDHPRLVLLCLPHTSNWDFVMAMLFLKAEKLQLTIFGKDGFYFFPLTILYKFFNVVPISRSKKSNFVEQAAKLYENDVALWTGMAPEGTRSKINSLKSGYYHLAKTADVWVTVLGMDYLHKKLVIKLPRPVLNTFEADEADLIEFSQSLVAKRNENNVK